MNIYLDVQSPAVKEAGKLASAYGLANHGLVNLRRAYWNLPTPALYEESIFRSEGSLSHLGPLVVDTGKHTARAAADKFVVREHSTEKDVWWGEYNRPFSAEKFSTLLTRMGPFQTAPAARCNQDWISSGAKTCWKISNPPTATAGASSCSSVDDPTGAGPPETPASPAGSTGPPSGATSPMSVLPRPGDPTTVFPGPLPGILRRAIRLVRAGSP